MPPPRSWSRAAPVMSALDSLNAPREFCDLSAQAFDVLVDDGETDAFFARAHLLHEPTVEQHPAFDALHSDDWGTPDHSHFALLPSFEELLASEARRQAGEAATKAAVEVHHEDAGEENAETTDDGSGDEARKDSFGFASPERLSSPNSDGDERNQTSIELLRTPQLPKMLSIPDFHAAAPPPTQSSSLSRLSPPPMQPPSFDFERITSRSPARIAARMVARRVAVNTPPEEDKRTTIPAIVQSRVAASTSLMTEVEFEMFHRQRNLKLRQEKIAEREEARNRPTELPRRPRAAIGRLRVEASPIFPAKKPRAPVGRVNAPNALPRPPAPRRTPAHSSDMASCDKGANATSSMSALSELLSGHNNRTTAMRKQQILRRQAEGGAGSDSSGVVRLANRVSSLRVARIVASENVEPLPPPNVKPRTTALVQYTSAAPAAHKPRPVNSAQPARIDRLNAIGHPDSHTTAAAEPSRGMNGARSSRTNGILGQNCAVPRQTQSRFAAVANDKIEREAAERREIAKIANIISKHNASVQSRRHDNAQQEPP
jgi:hypothetical protein